MNDQENKGDIHITSHNQSGGITAHTVNIGKRERKLDEAGKQGIETALKQFPNARRFGVTAIMGDPEAMNAAIEIRAYLQSTGRNVAQHIDQVAYGSPVYDAQTVEKDNGALIEIQVCTNRG